jgi:aminomethyltransferase
MFCTMTSETLGRTSLFDSHRAAGARIVPFAGWEMPVQYTGVTAESLAVRDNCGLFDVGHMGQLDVRGPGVTDALNRIVSADWSKVSVGRAAYALLLNERGGVHDDIMGYRLADEHWLVVANASRAHGDEEYLRFHLPPEISLSNRYANQAMIAIQGPRAEELLQPLCDADLSGFHFRDVRCVQVLGRPAAVARGGYTGCDGFEWMGDAESAPLLWQKLMEAGAAACGLGARDVLRLEAGLPLYGHELDEDHLPAESGVAFAVKMAKRDFVGLPALAALAASPPAHTLRGLRMEGRAIPREGYAVQSNGQEIGAVLSGTLSPRLEAGIAMARLRRDFEPGAVVDVVIRGALHPAQVVPLPFVPRSTKPVLKPQVLGAQQETP